MMTVSSQDRKFIQAASQGNLAEVQTGKLALQKSHDAGVKQVAQHLINDHTKAQQQLATLARSLNVTVPSSPNSEQKAIYQKWSKLSGTAFDNSYLHGELQDHVKTINLFQKEIKAGSNSSVKAYAQQTLPALASHESHLKQVAQQKGNSKTAAR